MSARIGIKKFVARGAAPRIVPNSYVSMFLNGAAAAAPPTRPAGAAGLAVGGWARKQKTGDGGGTGETDKAVHKMLWSLDTRLRIQEGRLPCYFLAEKDEVLVPAMIEGNRIYDDSKPDKGKPHSMGPRRTTLAAAFLNRIASADLTQAGLTGSDLLVTFFNRTAALTKTITVEEQQVLLKHLLESYTTPQMLETEVRACMFFKTKKNPKYLFSIEFNDHSPLKHCYDYIRICLKGAGAEPTDGSPPMGPLIRDIPRHQQQ